MTKNLSLEPKCLSSNPSSATQLWGTAIFSSVKSQKPLTLGCQGRGGGGITCEGLSGTCGPEGVGSNRYGLVFSYYFLPITSWFCFFFLIFLNPHLKTFFSLLIEKEKEERETAIVFLLCASRLGIRAATWACALTKNRTGDPSVMG